MNTLRVPKWETRAQQDFWGHEEKFFDPKVRQRRTLRTGHTKFILRRNPQRPTISGWRADRH
jgi:hypothetical protein